MSEWNPIESAPKEGAFLVFTPNERGNRIIQSAYLAASTLVVGGSFAFDLSKKPTHWMPLPSPPKDFNAR